MTIPFKSWLKQELVERVWTSIHTTVIGIVTLAATVFFNDLSEYLGTVDKPWARWALLAVSALLILIKQPRAVMAARSAAAAKVGAALVLIVGSLAFAAPARADWGVLCIKGCEKAAPRLSAPLKAEGDIPITSTVWIGPSVSMQLFQRDSAKAWSVSGTPTLSWGIFWKPPAWTTSASLLSLNVGVGIGSTRVFTDQSESFDVKLIPTIGIANLIQVGYGPSFHFATSAAQNDRVSGTLYLGVGTSIGGP